MNEDYFLDTNFFEKYKCRLNFLIKKLFINEKKITFKKEEKKIKNKREK